MIQTLKKYQGPLIICFVLSSLLLFMLFLFTYTPYMLYQHITTEQLIPVFFFVSGLILSFILYSILKKKFNFEISVFLYGVGFTSSCFTAIFYIFRLQGPTEEHLETIFLYLIPLTFLYYSYATMFKNTEKGVQRATLYLMIITTVFFAALTIFEIINYPVPWVGLLLLLFGSYFAYCLIHKKNVLTLQALYWIPFLFSWFVFLYLLLLRLLTRSIF
ncbi:hypothetical protein MmiHf6_12260 [Methanimicrococcus hongohii]|uniref:Uncharacterized protein n=1 Tax=Methanimicrococcus hongohii TaxID=3028295 RepID=A0AA97A295_9EURY|nr:hypothetical protein [Methanimicrococcus sp. Hf6]WNY23903.1 hypothetical protein MmiHf6_12260 [Methanimicrococcus sp. Hf6]